MGVGTEEPDNGLVALVGVVLGATVGDEVDGIAGGPEVAEDRGEWELSAVTLETAPGVGDVDRDARPGMLGTLRIRVPRFFHGPGRRAPSLG